MQNSLRKPLCKHCKQPLSEAEKELGERPKPDLRRVGFQEVR
jgi:hypothetical protein